MIAAWIGSIAFLGVAILYLLLTFGLPVGDFAMGGKYKIMPKQMRVTCAVSVVIQLIAILVLLQRGHVISFGIPQSIEKVACYFFAVYLLLNAVMNGLSKSKKEKAVMTPLSLVTAICFWIVAVNG